MKVPLFDVTRQYHEIRDEMLQAIDNVLNSGRFIMGPNVEAFEKEMSAYLGVKHAIGVANGSDALYIAVKALGISKGDYVITTAFSFFATASCITRNGATPIFVDIDPKTFNIDLDQVEEVLKSHPKKDKIKAIIPVHLFGRTVDLQRLEKIRNDFGVKIIEDCAQSVGSYWIYSNGEIKKSGSIGDLSTLSFFPTKNLGACGDGGMILTNDDNLADFCKIFRVHGARKKYFHEIEGINSRLDEIQAAILRVKLKYLEQYHEKRIKIARTYNGLFSSLKLDLLEIPQVHDDFRCIFHQYVVRVKDGHRESLKEYLSSKGVETAIYYPLGLHKQKCFSHFEFGSLQNTEKACEEVLALPIFPEITEPEIEYVVKCMDEYFKEAKKC
ncbi:MAG TPA: DegT/DnrJ/EryC1/StrS family aminotransferase [Pseudothermotoga sp.]|uniref:DegT/DnrJ/EryC1/StrS family aminotransferase n=1 Tax=Thermotoga profunda TaxID=1508420 RepID=UPI0005978620|nr:DegT/DnrJ/EryC1/StrS family aminotransferase [Thermotoga profunda]